MRESCVQQSCSLVCKLYIWMFCCCILYIYVSLLRIREKDCLYYNYHIQVNIIHSTTHFDQVCLEMNTNTYIRRAANKISIKLEIEMETRKMVNYIEIEGEFSIEQ